MASCAMPQNDAARQRRPDHCDDAGDAGQNTGYLAPGQFLVIGEKMRQNHHENRRSGIENRGGAAVDKLLRPADHVERQTGIDDAQKADRQPRTQITRKRQAHEPANHNHKRHRKRQPEKNQPEWRQFAQRNLEEHERAPPDHRQYYHPQPVCCFHNAGLMIQQPGPECRKYCKLLQAIERQPFALRPLRQVQKHEGADLLKHPAF